MTSRNLKTLSLKTIGCRLNQYETEKIASDLMPYGFRRVPFGQVADLYVINTCTVTHRADSDARNLIRRAARQNPSGRIVVTGCYVDNDPQLIAGMEGVDVIIRNKEKSSIVDILQKKLPELFRQEPDRGCSTSIRNFHAHNRAWVKISDGCNQWCSFCIIPSVRGRLRNRPPREIIDEINLLVQGGYHEVVLTGVHLGHYKNHKSEPQVKNLAALCRMIMAETDLYRMRISSIEPQTVRDDLLQAYADSNGRICRHFHMPLQSGSSRILKLMRRPYDQKTYVQRVRAVRKAVPETVVGADVVVGFPGESKQDFDHTRRLAESGLLDYLHVFSYSDRPGTTSSRMTGKIKPDLIKERNTILSLISNGLRYDLYRRQIGKTLEVISESKKRNEGHYWGISDSYVRAKLPGNRDSGKKIVRVRITSAGEKYVEGDTIESSRHPVAV